MTILLSDRRVAAVPVRDAVQSLVRLDVDFGPARAWVRRGLAERLVAAQHVLPADVRLRVVEGHRPVRQQWSMVAAYAAELRRLHPGLPDAELRRLTSRFVSPVEVAPHVAAAAVDLTLVDPQGAELDMGTPIDATPEQSGGACYFAAEGIDPGARERRELMAKVLCGAGLVNYPTEWWHWSYGDRYWAVMTDAPAALYGPVLAEPVA